MKHVCSAALLWLLAARAVAVPAPVDGLDGAVVPRAPSTDSTLCISSSTARMSTVYTTVLETVTVCACTSATTMISSVAPEPTGATSTSSCASPSQTSVSDVGYASSLYFTNWGIYGADFQPQQIPADKVTRILYAFADIGSDGTVKSSDTYADLQKHYPTDSWNDAGTNAYGCVKQLFLLKKRHRHLKVLLSIGGWTYSPKFAPVAATATGRATFAASAVRLVADWGFDGVDIDWEYPASAAEAQDYVLLLRAVRDALDAHAAKHAPGYRFLLTVASPAGPQHYDVLDLGAMDAAVDAWNLMAYDYAGSWDSTSGHQANIYLNPDNARATKFSTDRAVRDYVARGVAPRKLMMGLPLYGRSFEATAGLGDVYAGVGPGTLQAGVWLYKDLPRAGAAEAYDAVAKASYSYDAATRELISYDNAASAREKTAYLAAHGLGGTVFWEASGDRNDSRSLVATVAASLGRRDAAVNLLHYPDSQYDNIRSGMPDA